MMVFLIPKLVLCFGLTLCSCILVNVASFEIYPRNQRIVSFKNRGKRANVGMMAFHFFNTQSETIGKSVSHNPSSVDTVVPNDELLRNVSETTQLLLGKPSSFDQQYHVRFTDCETREIKATSKTAFEGRTLYDVLGTTPAATKEELKRQYIKLAKSTHPDALISQQHINPHIYAPCDFSEVASAYRILSNPLERKRYDRSLQCAKSIVLMALIGEVLIGTTLTVAEISSAVVLVALTIVIQPISVRFANDLFISSNSNKNASTSTWDSLHGRY